MPGTGAAIAALPGDAELMRAVAAKLVAAGRDALLYAPDAGTVLLVRAAGSTLDCAALWKQLAAKLGGRGGGKPDRADGRLAHPVDNWVAVVGELVSA
jgi:alanyl-tRNA synthetase